MEGRIESKRNLHETLESKLLTRHDLRPGVHISLEKVALEGGSNVPVGAVHEGTLVGDVQIGHPIELSSGARTTDVLQLEEKDGVLFIHTETSVYRLKLAFDDIDRVESAKGSTYRYLPDGTTQRFKAVEGREYEPNAALVYVPDWEWVQAHAPKQVLDQLGENGLIYTDTLLHYVQNPFKEENKKVYIIDKDGRQVETNQELQKIEGPLYLTFLSDGHQDFSIPVSHTPRIGWMTFDTRRYIDEETGESMRERHLGNPVTRIVRKTEY